MGVVDNRIEHEHRVGDAFVVIDLSDLFVVFLFDKFTTLCHPFLGDLLRSCIQDVIVYYISISLCVFVEGYNSQLFVHR